MGKIQKEITVKLIIGFIYSEAEGELLKKAIRNLEKKFGQIDFESDPSVFNYTDYYENELGQKLFRKFISFKRLISPGSLSYIKRCTNQLEKRFLKNGKRRINIDPGYICASKLILATTKDYSHRIYLSKGIFAEVTLAFKANSFKAMDWTYPDYRTDAYCKIFNQIRSNYLKQIR